MNAIITFNPENWVNNSATAAIIDNTILINGNSLELVHNEPILDEEGNSKWDFYSVTVRYEGGEFCTMGRFGGDNEWECHVGDISRQHADPHILAAIMACNLL